MTLWTRHVRWTDWTGRGIEHLTLAGDDAGVRACGVVVGERGGAPYGLIYNLKIDSAWRVREATIELTDGTAARLKADGEGRWTDGAGVALPDLDGCVDIDIAATPFTNTLPIRRLGLDIGARADIRVAYIPLPGLAPEPVDQRYTRLGERRWLYEGLFRRFAAELDTDEDGLVLDYPDTFRRTGGDGIFTARR